MNFFFRLLVGLLFGGGFSWAAQAQIVRVPLHQVSSTGSLPTFRMAEDSIPADSATVDSVFLVLPFIEDFSATRTRQPDTLKWLPRGGTHINNEMGTNPPSFNFATFDGFDAAGNPYNSRMPTEVDTTDRLVSHYFDLRPYQVSDRLLLSFFWQLEGLGERPDAEDFLQLQFKDSTQNWITQWQRQGGDTAATPFVQEAVYIENPAFFHRDFQFRFQSRGRRSGSFDVWNLDYIYLDTGRAREPLAYLDIAANRAANDYLKGPYRAVPFDHYFADPVRWTQTDSLKALYNNLDQTFNVIEYECAILDASTDRFLSFLRVDSLLDRNTRFVEGNQRNRPLYAQPKTDIIRPGRPDQNTFIIAQQFRVSTGEEKDLIPTNDTLTTYNILSDYYAYDDGTAEFAAGVNQRFGKLAYRYAIAQPDELTGIDFYFPSVGEDLQGQTFMLYVWKKLDSATVNPQDEVLYEEEVTFESALGVNTLTRHNFREPVPVEDTIYIGWQQLGEEFLVAGLDRNTDSGEEIFFNVANRWERNQTIAGSLLLRPVFGDLLVSGTEEETQITEEWLLFPNPSTGYFRVRHPSGQRPERLTLVDMRGNVVADLHHAAEMQVHTLPKGIYLLQIQTKNGFFTKKLYLCP
ncbi:MAG: T9SS type A sorting domain-containing protein [Bernardetiaceae bacterium]